MYKDFPKFRERKNTHALSCKFIIRYSKNSHLHNEPKTQDPLSGQFMIFDDCDWGEIMNSSHHEIKLLWNIWRLSNQNPVVISIWLLYSGYETKNENVSQTGLSCLG